MEQGIEEMEVPFGAKDSEIYEWEYTIPEDCEAKIENGKVIVRRKESEGERIRSAMLRGFNSMYANQAVPTFAGEPIRDIIAWLEQQCKQNSAWSEEDEIGLGDALWAIQKARTIAKDENDMGNLWCAEGWLKSLKDRYTWKPSEAQKNALYHIVRDFGKDKSEDEMLLESLLSDLDRL